MHTQRETDRQIQRDSDIEGERQKRQTETAREKEGETHIVVACFGTRVECDVTRR